LYDSTLTSPRRQDRHAKLRLRWRGCGWHDRT
jgi:hypothetical protein